MKDSHAKHYLPHESGPVGNEHGLPYHALQKRLAALRAELARLAPLGLRDGEITKVSLLPYPVGVRLAWQRQTAPEALMCLDFLGAHVAFKGGYFELPGVGTLTLYGMPVLRRTMLTLATDGRDWRWLLRGRTTTAWESFHGGVRRWRGYTRSARRVGL